MIKKIFCVFLTLFLIGTVMNWLGIDTKMDQAEDQTFQEMDDVTTAQNEKFGS